MFAFCLLFVRLPFKSPSDMAVGDSLVSNSYSCRSLSPRDSSALSNGAAFGKRRSGLESSNGITSLGRQVAAKLPVVGRKIRMAFWKLSGSLEDCDEKFMESERISTGEVSGELAKSTLTTKSDFLIQNFNLIWRPNKRSNLSKFRRRF